MRIFPIEKGEAQNQWQPIDAGIKEHSLGG
jgi:hypothetical protein